ncbi:hypothetical protein [Pseudomonas syringae]|uniref:hypothetical protein n=1 Tax=Pseudomonas syringae TaxID=317 RepID=UPI0018E6540C|nr:hypothetical protein [Pseudomonas syringae]MBI6750755.1 hypothetical protein [Pseudomonas syringae]MBI6770538.1 hypothetical protein [Pseudomonas syringae]MBI6774090.1 hypothetical protein [Pseudomonas syringae]MBI6790880.1 hypothetical protein [Pseudomonas syringae]MBI6803719.1 hypothetical protein [Pseudomonas syringae]
MDLRSIPQGEEKSLKLLTSFWNVISPDRRPEREKAREREFILAANSLKTLSVTDRGGMSIDPEELREHIISAREQLKHLVTKPGAPPGPSRASENHRLDQGADFAAEASVGPMDCIEVVAWRRLSSGAAVRYTCFQRVDTGVFVVATARLFSGGAESLPHWIDSDTHRQVACVLQSGGLHWHATLGQAMNAWDAEL